MMRNRLPLVCCGCWLSLLAGCAHLVESRVIQAFADSLQKEDLGGLRQESSAEFESKALGRDDALQSFKLVGMPEGKPKVVKVEDDGDEKRVTVEVGEKSKKRKLLYKLIRDDSKKWVVDDIYLNRKELADNKSVSEQVNLQLCVRDFLEAWERGDRTGVLTCTTPEFRQSLTELPPKYLAGLTKRLLGEVTQQDKVNPDVQIGEEGAEVRFPKLNGELIVLFRKVQEKWKADEVKVESTRDGESIRSVREMAAATAAAITFQTAYNAADKRELARVCTPRFFDGSLSAANLSLIKLPVRTQTDGDEFEIKVEGKVANFVVQGDREVLKISLNRQQELDQPNAAPQYRVEDVTIYEMQGRQDKRLSALFTSHALMRVFGEGLLTRDLETLRLSATRDFNERVWDRVKPTMMELLPLDQIHAGEPEILNTVFQGPLTQITVEQGQGPITYVLRDHGGKMQVDDVLVPAVTHPESLKTTLELMVPVLDFTAALRVSLAEQVRENSSREFNRLVWNQFEGLPELEPNPQIYLRLPVNKINQVAERAVVVLGNERQGAQVFLIRERDRYVVDDVLLITGPESQHRVALKRSLYRRMADTR